MGKLLRFRRREAAPMARFAANLARLEEEITLTVGYSRAMVRERKFVAAAGVVDEQRARLAHAFDDFERAVVTPARRRHRAKVVATGLAAAALVGSAAFAGFGPAGGSAHGAPKVIREAQRTLGVAQRATNPDDVGVLVGKVHRELLTLKPDELADHQDEVRNLLNIERDLLSRLPNVSAELLKQVEVLAEQIKLPAPPPQPAPQPQPPSAPSPEQPEASAPSTS